MFIPTPRHVRHLRSSLKPGGIMFFIYKFSLETNLFRGCKKKELMLIGSFCCSISNLGQFPSLHIFPKSNTGWELAHCANNWQGKCCESEGCGGGSFQQCVLRDRLLYNAPQNILTWNQIAAENSRSWCGLWRGTQVLVEASPRVGGIFQDRGTHRRVKGVST